MAALQGGKEKMPNARFWKTVIAVFNWMAFFTAVAGLLLLNLTIFELQFARDGDGDSEPLDSPLNFWISAKVPIIYALGWAAVWIILFPLVMKVTRVSPWRAAGLSSG
jgi:hypothetical protein